MAVLWPTLVLNVFSKERQIEDYKIEEIMVSKAGIEEWKYLQRPFLGCLTLNIYLEMSISSTNIPKGRFVVKLLDIQNLKGKEHVFCHNATYYCLNCPNFV